MRDLKFDFFDLKVLSLLFNGHSHRISFISVITIFLLPFLIKAQVITVVSLNLRGDIRSDGQNRWAYRKQPVMDFLTDVNPDILCFQEAEDHQIEDIKKQFPHLEAIGDSCEDCTYYYKRPVPIFFHKGKFEKINSGRFGLSENPDSIGFIGWDAKYARMAIWVNLKSLQTEKNIFVINTHLDNVGARARMNGIKQILDSMPLIQIGENVILTGDFNSGEKSEVYQYVTHYLKDTYHHSQNVNGVKYTFHGFGKRELPKRYKIDYIFVNDSTEVQSVVIPEETPVNGVYLSDHNPIISVITLK